MSLIQASKDAFYSENLEDPKPNTPKLNIIIETWPSDNHRPHNYNPKI